MPRIHKDLDDVPPISDAEIERELRTDEWPQLQNPPPPARIFKTMQPPASNGDVTALLATCGGLLPDSYLRFLKESNGAESGGGDQSGDCLVLWNASKISEMNQAYGIPGYLPEFLAIGSDGGADAVGFDRIASTDPEKWPVVRIGFGNIDRSDFRTLASGFLEWQEHGFPLKNFGSCCGGS